MEKVSLKIMNSGLILKTFTHEFSLSVLKSNTSYNFRAEIHKMLVRKAKLGRP